jgi:APA family basic amino acid/polyamine antiporter
MIVMGGIVGAGIFMNPYVVARRAGTPARILLAWVLGGLVALAGAFIWAELAARRPAAGGQYAYLREAFGPLPAFLYGWTLLLVVQSGGMAAVAMTFARYALDLAGGGPREGAVAAAALLGLTAVNCLGVRWGSGVQNALMVLKLLAIGGLVAFGLLAVPSASGAAAAAPPGLASLGAALVPVLFAYGGWQTATFVAAEMRRPERDLPRGLLLGMAGVVAVYLAVNAVCVRALGADGLAATTTPASDVMRRALGEPGARAIALGIAVSTLGFLSQSILTAPRVYFAMAADGVLPRVIGTRHPRTEAPVAAIVLQGIVATVVALSGRYEQILSYVVSVDMLFFAATAAGLFVLRRREGGAPRHRVPGHPWTTAAFVAACLLVALSAVLDAPANTAVGLGILLSGVPVYHLWRRSA